MTNPDAHATDLPFEVIETEWIAMSDGARLAARFWLPRGAQAKPAPAILEYLPYRRRDGTRLRDDATYPFLARHGYAGVRVDLRGCGDSSGLLHGEYTEQELRDGVEVIAWIARQPWCSGAVGMLGISWGGFNGLQIAALAPPALKAIVTVCSSDDRYADDIHYKGGCLLNDNLCWSQQMLSYSSRPPDPRAVGDNWRAMWRERLEQMPHLAANWLRHQHRDSFWRHGSVGENPQAIRAAVLAVGGWADPYTDTVLRLMDDLTAPRRAIIGPWEHAYPHLAAIGPRIDFLNEILKWWQRWLKNDGDDDSDDAQTIAFIEDATKPNTEYAPRAGHWRAFDAPPSRVASEWVLHLREDGLGDEPAAAGAPPLRIASPQDVGACAGSFCPGMRVAHELPDDQRDDDAKSLCFDTPPLSRKTTLFGAPRVRLRLASDQPSGFIVARLCEVAPDDSSTLLSWGALNLAHHQSDAAPSPLQASQSYAIEIELNNLGRSIPRGHRLRLALSNAYWPMLWSPAAKSELRLTAAECALTLPRLDAESFASAEFASPSAPLDVSPSSLQRKPSRRKTRTREDDGTVVLEAFDDFGTIRHGAIDLTTESSVRERFTIHPDDPLSARAEVEWTQTLTRARDDDDENENDWRIHTHTRGAMHADATHYHLHAHLRAYESDELVFEREWEESIARD